MVANLGLLVDNPGSGLKVPIDVYLDTRQNTAEGTVEEFDGKISAFGIDDPGNGYISGVNVDIVGGGGTGGQINSIFVGSIDNITNLIGGNIYKEKPNIIFEGPGLRADAICEISGFIKSIDIAEPGCYSAIPDIVVEGDGTGARLKANISGYIYKTIIIFGGLFPIDVIPTVNITVTSGENNGSIGAIMARINDDYHTISSLSIISAGSGYSVPPTLSISGSMPGYPASGYCLINAGISSIDILSPGSGYTKIPSIIINRNDPLLPKPSGIVFINQIIESQTPTQTPTPTPSITAAVTLTPTITPTITCTKTPSYTPPVTFTPTPTHTPTATSANRTLHGPVSTANLPTVTPTTSPTMTRTVTGTSTVTPSFTASPTVSRTQTGTPVSTVTPTVSPTMTTTCSPTSTISPTPSITPTQTNIRVSSPIYDAILIPRMSYGVSKINILQGGSYREPPRLIVKPPVVAGYRGNITNIGSRSFNRTPNLVIRGCTAASPYKETRIPKAIPIINYSIGQVEIINGGYDYTTPPTINLFGGYNPISGVCAVLSAELGADGSVSAISIDNSGNYYRTAPDIYISSNDHGYGLTIKVKMSGVLEDIYITDPGLNITSGTPNTTIFIEGGGGPVDSVAHISFDSLADSGIPCTATPELNYKLRSLEIINAGENYACSPNIIIPSGESVQKDFSRISQARPAKAQVRILGLVKKINISKKDACMAQPKIFRVYGSYFREISYTSGINLAYITANELNTQIYNLTYNYNNSINAINALSQQLFPQKPHLSFSSHIDIIANTYLKVSSLGAYDIREPINRTNIKNTYLCTDKVINMNTHYSLLNSLIETKSSAIFSNNLNDLNNPYSSVSPSECLSVRGKIVGLGFNDYGNIDFNQSAHSYYGDGYFMQCVAFFDAMPILDIEDEIGSGASVTIESSLDNSMVRLIEYAFSDITYSGNVQPSYITIDNYIASGIFPSSSVGAGGGNLRSDISITNANDYSSCSILTCIEPGVPLSWNNKPNFDVEINGDGTIKQVHIQDGGKGFFPQNAYGNYDKRKHEIYFSGGGGSGAMAIYTTDIVPDSKYIHGASGTITSIIIKDSGRNYVSPPSAIVIDYNPTWKDYFFHNKIYPSDNSLSTITPYFSPFHFLDFYFKNPKIYNYNTKIKGYGITNNQFSTSILPNNSIDLYSSWIQSKYSEDINLLLSPYKLVLFGNDGYVDNILFTTDSSSNYKSTRYLNLPLINITNAGILGELVSLLPSFTAFKPTWNKEIFSETILIRDDNIIQ